MFPQEQALDEFTCQLLLPRVGPLEGGQGGVHGVQPVTQLGQHLMTPPISPQVGVGQPPRRQHLAENRR